MQSRSIFALPEHDICTENWNTPNYIHLVDVQVNVPENINILINLSFAVDKLIRSSLNVFHRFIRRRGMCAIIY